MRKHIRSVAMAVAAIALTGAGARAQALGGTGVTLAAGVMNYDLSGTGNTPVIALRVDRPISPVFRVEGAITGAKPDQQFGGAPLFLIPEVQLQAELPLHGLAPYLGVGLGLSYRASSDGVPSRTEVAFSGGAGTRVSVSSTLAAVLDGRVHALGSNFAGTTAELSLGLRLRMGGNPDAP
jgi:hypothetical protein